MIQLPNHHLAPAAALPTGLALVRSAARDEDTAAGDERQVFEVRMRTAWPRVVRLVERLLAWPGSRSEVEDVAQETFLAAWRTRDTFRGEADWSTWVHTIALRRARNAARSRERRQRWFGRPAQEPELDSLELDGGGDASTDREVSRSVRDALRNLRHVDREVLVLRYLEGLAVEEMATRLELGRSAVDARLSRARTRMRAFVEARDGAEELR